MKSSVIRLFDLIKERGFKGVLTHWFYYRQLFKNKPEKQVKFIIFGQGRTGSTLLSKLIDQHPDIFCDREIFGSKKSPKFVFPRLFVESNSRKPEADGYKIYGFKVKVYQLYTDQNIKNVKSFLESLHRNGWKFIFLYREDELAHSVSAVKAYSLGKWFVDSSDSEPDSMHKKLYVDPIQFKNSILWRRKFAIMERDCLANIPHISISYENDLLMEGSHQTVCNRIFDFLGVSSIPIKADIQKMNNSNLKDSVENYQEIEDLYLTL